MIDNPPYSIDQLSTLNPSSSNSVEIPKITEFRYLNLIGTNRINSISNDHHQFNETILLTQLYPPVITSIQYSVSVIKHPSFKFRKHSTVADLEVKKNNDEEVIKDALNIQANRSLKNFQ
ncbi:hypothetical protein CLIB1444_25S00188 [[Candida] jaroonii]|uniref:Uncharacterized protein n=1 Tax=[Candida] jaroonii TaxID=467808 RepID=A0ACA9YFX5_9ASCO|nr:hypothetical protein CLIB1444_25S00188 [[Candida] jaroonii]